jgi:hypothetical protein
MHVKLNAPSDALLLEGLFGGHYDAIRTHDQRKEQQTVSIDLIWSVASSGACDV